MLKKQALSREDVHAIMNVLEPLMMRHDYQRRDGIWYHFSPELIRAFEFLPGSFRKKAYFSVGLLIRALDDSPRPLIADCSVFGRIDHLVLDVERYESATSFGVPGTTSAERITYIATIVDTVVLPFLATLKTVADLRELCGSPAVKGLTVHESAKHILPGTAPLARRIRRNPGIHRDNRFVR